jgi:squalene synthase HpnD
MTDLAEPSKEQSAPSPSPADSASRAHVRRIVEGSGSSFYWAMRLLPPERREAMFAIYAFCREVDDIADGVAPPDQRCRDLEAWREEIERLYRGAPTRPTTQALLAPLTDYDLPKAEFLAILDGMAMDAREEMRAPPMEELLLYCRRVAGAVGVLSVHAFGAADARAQELAVAEGEALQLTNILRDLAEDAERERLYLPRELLQEAGLAALSPGELLDHPQLPQVCFALAELAEERFTRARALLAGCDRKALRPAAMMLEAYGRVLARLKQQGWRDPHERVTLPRLEKLWVVLRHGLL